ncbi:glucan endo-1,3-beta-glucosidase 4-like protein [Tanacetum coccineum]
MVCFLKNGSSVFALDHGIRKEIYRVGFRRKVVDSDCLQDGLHWACGQGHANRMTIQSAQACYLPNTVKDHASYAYNDYYQRKRDIGGMCDFGGTGILTNVDPSRRFGFVRFIKNPDQANLLEDLNKIWIGSHHLFASIARFDRKQNSQPNQSHQKQSNNTKPHETGHASHTTGGRSYASVLNGKEGTQKPVLAGPITKNITLENSDLLELSDTSSVVLAKGDFWALDCNSADESLRLKFKNIRRRNYGLPLNAWTTNAFKKIAGNWGETVFVDEDADENIANGREIHCIKESQEEGRSMIRKEQMGLRYERSWKSVDSL